MRELAEAYASANSVLKIAATLYESAYRRFNYWRDAPIDSFGYVAACGLLVDAHREACRSYKDALASQGEGMPTSWG